MPTRRAALLVLALTLTLACAAHEKAGDRAASTGDWKTAERAYSEALRKDPDKKELQEKYRTARAAALEDAVRRADACEAARDWECAYAEAGYAVRLEPGHAGMAALRREAAREVGLLRVRRAEEAGRARDFAGGLQLLASAREASDDAGVAAAARRATPALVDGAVAEAEALLREAQFPRAIDLLALAADADPAQRGRLERARADHERWKDAEAERLADEGDARLAQRRWADARQSYDAALQLRPQGRARPLAQYARHMAEADAAVAKRDFAAAERALAAALQDGVDRAFVEGELDRVRVRPYAIRLRSVLVQPVRPDGWPWTGGRTRELERVVARLAAFQPSIEPGQPLGGAALDAVRRLPVENQPILAVAVSLPDGRVLSTPPRRGAYALLDGSFVVAANGFDDRVVVVTVTHELGGGARPLHVGEVRLTLGELVTAGGTSAGGQSVLQLRVEADPADAPEGSFAGLLPVPDAGNLADSWSVPAPGSRAFRVVKVDAAVPPRPSASSPELVVELEQRGRVIFRTPAAPRSDRASWSPPAAYVFAEPTEHLQVRLLDRASGTVLLADRLAGAALEDGTADVRGAAGATVTLRAEARRAGPGDRR